MFFPWKLVLFPPRHVHLHNMRAHVMGWGWDYLEAGAESWSTLLASLIFFILSGAGESASVGLCEDETPPTDKRRLLIGQETAQRDESN